MSRHEYPSLRQGLVGAWCPSRSGSVNLVPNLARQSNNATNSGSLTASDGGTALDLSATQFASVGSATTLFPDLTKASWAGWFRFRSFVGSYGNLFITEAVTNFQINPLIKSNGKLAIYCGTNAANTAYDGTGAFTLSTNVWYHIACVFQGGVELTGYVNGILDATVSSPISSLTSTSSASRIGLLSSSTRGINAQLDDVRLYSRALTLPEIRLLASRRGIGLSPLPDRAAGLPKKLFVNDAGTWRNGDAYVNTGSGWRLGVPFVNVAGTWR
jgi:hypothetical protein